MNCHIRSRKILVNFCPKALTKKKWKFFFSTKYDNSYTNRKPLSKYLASNFFLNDFWLKNVNFGKFFCFFIKKISPTFFLRYRILPYVKNIKNSVKNGTLNYLFLRNFTVFLSFLMRERNHTVTVP
jgi:hypothetical protein